MADLSVKQFLIRRGFNPNKGIRQVTPNEPVVSVRNLFKMENVATIDIYPPTIDLTVPQTYVFEATVKDGFHTPKEGVHVIWDLSNYAAGSVSPKDTKTDADGHAKTVFTAAAVGKTTTKIYAKCEGKTGIAEVTVNPTPTQAVLHILDTWAEPASPDPGQPFTVYCTYCNNGNKASDPFKIRFERDGGKDSVEINSRSFEPNEHGKEGWPFNNGLTAGEHSFDVYLIPGGDNNPHHLAIMVGS